MKTLVLLGLLVGMSACASAPTLQERLANKGPEERKAILHEECLSQTSRKVRHGHNLPKAQIKRGRDLCDAMANEMKNAQ